MITKPAVSEKDNVALLNEAICYATEKHAGQRRKGSGIPYILHPLEALNILCSMNADMELMIAGVLHDTVEDTTATVEEITERFGAGVAALVCANSEDKSKSWDERKKHTIEFLATADRQVKLLVMADKLSNLRSMARDYKVCGDKLWDRFNAPVEKQDWYYSGILDALADMQVDPDAGDVYSEMVSLYKDIF